MTKVRYRDEYPAHIVLEWCKQNCQSRWFHGRDWEEWVVGQSNKMVEFTDEQDALLFSLRWS